MGAGVHAGTEGQGVRQPMSGSLSTKSKLTLGPLGIEVVRPGTAHCAPLDVLRRRTYLRLIPLPRGRYLLIGWLSL